MKTGMRAISIVFILAFILLGCNAAPATQSNATQTSAQALATSSTVTSTPMPAATLMNNTPTVAQTSTVVSSTPTSPPILPTPNGTFDMNYYLTPPVFTPEPTFPPPPTPQAPIPPSAITLSNKPINLTNGATPLIWAAQAKEDSLTLWLGYLNESPAPHIVDAHPIVEWGKDIVLAEDMKVSPDQKSIALITKQDNHQEGGSPTWLWTVDLTTNKIHLIPDPTNPGVHLTYEDAFNGNLAGWVDNNHILFETWPAIATKDGASKVKCTVLPANSGARFMAVSADRTTVFADVDGNTPDVREYWLFDSNCNTGHEIVSELHNSRTSNLVKGLPATYGPQWSPDGKSVVFTGPGLSAYLKSYLWLINIGSSTVEPISPVDAVDFSPAWSPDSSHIAFLRADQLLTTEETYNDITQYSSNVYLWAASDQTFKKLTHFTGMRNAYLQWTASSKYLFATSTTGNQPTSLVAISLSSGNQIKLLDGTTDYMIASPILFP